VTLLFPPASMYSDDASPGGQDHFSVFQGLLLGLLNIRYLRDNLPADTVIFANGNILNYGDIDTCLEATGFIDNIKVSS
jgi:tRNA-dihydrouridine synthase